jgi:PAS domain S-box-containing protein
MDAPQEPKFATTRSPIASACFATGMVYWAVHGLHCQKPCADKVQHPSAQRMQSYRTKSQPLAEQAAKLADLSQQLQQEQQRRQLAEIALQDVQARFSELLEITGDAILSVDAQQQIIAFNPAAEKIFGYSAAEILGQPLDLLLPDRAQSPQASIDCINTLQTLQRPIHRLAEECREIIGRRKDGTEFPIEANISQIQLSNGLVWTAFLRDLSNLKEAEAAIQASENRWQFALEGCEHGVWDWDIPTNRIFYSRRWKEMLGYTEAEISDSPSEWETRIHPADKARVLAETAAHLAGKNTHFSAEYRFQNREGKYLWILDRALVVKRSPEGHPLRVIGTHSDITDRKQAERELDLQAVITRNMAEGICLVRVDDGMIVYANPKFERMFGYELGELINQHVSIVNYGDTTIDPEAVNQSIRNTVLTRGEATYQVRNVKKDGTPFWCEATTSIFEHPEYGTVLVAVQQDITKRKEAEQRIQASLKEKEVLLKEVHHRVKNNLQIIHSLLQMQARRIQDPEISAILKDSQHRVASIALVHEKLYGSEDLANINLAQYIPDLTFHLLSSYQLHSHPISLKTDIDPILLEIGTAISYGLIINELVSNALKYAFLPNQPGEVAVELRAAPDRILQLVVRDNGQGLPAGFNLESTQSLGLTLVQGLVEQLDGTLEVTSHEGTQFKITFPLP